MNFGNEIPDVLSVTNIFRAFIILYGYIYTEQVELPCNYNLRMAKEHMQPKIEFLLYSIYVMLQYLQNQDKDSFCAVSFSKAHF